MTYCKWSKHCSLKTNYSNTDSPWLKSFNLQWFDFLDFTMMWEEYTPSRNCISNFEFLSVSWASDVQYDTTSWCWPVAGACIWSHEEKQPTHLQPFLTHKTTLLFTFNTAFHKLHETFNILLLHRFCIKQFFLAGFEHMQVRLVKALMSSRLDILSAFLTYTIFNFWQIYQDTMPS